LPTGFNKFPYQVIKSGLNAEQGVSKKEGHVEGNGRIADEFPPHLILRGAITLWHELAGISVDIRKDFSLEAFKLLHCPQNL
jgi:hypothetical protein